MNKNIKHPHLAAKLRELRKSHSYKQEDVAAALDVVRQTYANYEQGIRTPSHEILYKLAGFYHISIDDLMHLLVELDPETYFDAPKPSQSSEDLSGFVEFFSDPKIEKKFKCFTNLEKELFYYFMQISDSDKKEIIEITKLKAHKK